MTEADLRTVTVQGSAGGFAQIRLLALRNGPAKKECCCGKN